VGSQADLDDLVNRRRRPFKYSRFRKFVVGVLVNKKDRIAVAISVLYSLIPLGILGSGGSEAPLAAAFYVSPVVAYWGYRFVKGDISFIKTDEGKKD
jgi:hypothetical protein